LNHEVFLEGLELNGNGIVNNVSKAQFILFALGLCSNQGILTMSHLRSRISILHLMKVTLLFNLGQFLL